MLLNGTVVNREVPELLRGRKPYWPGLGTKLMLPNRVLVLGAYVPKKDIFVEYHIATGKHGATTYTLKQKASYFWVDSQEDAQLRVIVQFVPFGRQNTGVTCTPKRVYMP
jgi:hypothetical protein